jgi:hypothetical protein
MKTILITIAVSVIALCGGIAIGYHHGYMQGSNNESSRWKILSMGKEPFPNTTMIGVRELWVYSDGTRVPAARIVSSDKNVNSIPILPTTKD